MHCNCTACTDRTGNAGKLLTVDGIETWIADCISTGIPDADSLCKKPKCECTLPFAVLRVCFAVERQRFGCMLGLTSNAFPRPLLLLQLPLQPQFFLVLLLFLHFRRCFAAATTASVCQVGHIGMCFQYLPYSKWHEYDLLTCVCSFPCTRLSIQ